MRITQASNCASEEGREGGREGGKERVHLLQVGFCKQAQRHSSSTTWMHRKIDALLASSGTKWQGPAPERRPAETMPGLFLWLCLRIGTVRAHASHSANCERPRGQMCRFPAQSILLLPIATPVICLNCLHHMVHTHCNFRAYSGASRADLGGENRTGT